MRRRRLLALAALIALIAVGAVAVASLRTYAPLAYEGGAWGVGGFAVWSPRVLAETGFGDEGRRIRLRDDAGRGGEFRLGFDVTNRGRLPVRIVGLVPTIATWEGQFRLDSLALPRDAGEPSVGDTVPFEPVPIEPGETRFVVVVGRLAPCEAPWTRAATGYSAQSTDRIALVFETLRVLEVTQEVLLPAPLEVACADIEIDDSEWEEADG